MDQPNTKKVLVWITISLIALVVLSLFFIGLAKFIEYLIPQETYGAEVNAAVLMGAVSALVPATVGIATIYITYKINRQTQNLMLRQLRQNQMAELWKKRFDVYLELFNSLANFKIYKLIHDVKMIEKDKEGIENIQEKITEFDRRLLVCIEENQIFIMGDLAEKIKKLTEIKEWIIVNDQGQREVNEDVKDLVNSIKEHIRDDLGIDTFNEEMKQLFNMTFHEENDNEKGIQ